MKNRFAFTLAEVMIVVVIIGVVAALVLPNFIEDMAERINSNRQANIAQKITKSVELMAVNGDYQDIYTTEQFVNKLSKYLKIAKICDLNNIAQCWPTSTIKDAKGKSYDISNAKTGNDLHIGTSTNNVGLLLADGTSMILNFNPDAPSISTESTFKATKESLPIGGGKTDSFAYTSSATGAIDFVMDVNGATGPNQESDGENYYDIRSFKIASFALCNVCKKEEKIDGMCIKDLGTKYTPEGTNHWLGAKKACENLGMELPSVGTLLMLYQNYKGQGQVPTEGVYLSNQVNGTNALPTYFNMANGVSSVDYNNKYYKALCISK